ncbi:MAG TPA: HEAT repeat domain-containing protein [Pyrinomonadaceae bacterium]|nr:HEAT repeat domain-containing protein [Pyrinomonadaceae bacterium]
MPDETVVKVMKILSAIEIPPSAAQVVEQMGHQAVTVVCEVALGSYPGLRQKVRTNAVSLLGWMTRPQAVETTALLVNDPNPDIAIRALRAAGRQKNDNVVDKIGQMLNKPAANPLIVAEGLKALLAIDSSKSKSVFEGYEKESPNKVPHRATPLVQEIITKRRKD